MVDTQITLADIAERAGVSQATVSKVLNGRADVASGTRARVEHLLVDAGYQRRRRATTIDTAPYTALDLAIPLVSGPWAAEIIHGVEVAARSLDAVVSLFELGQHHEHTDAWLESAIARAPSAVVLVFTTLSKSRRGQLRTRGIPCVVLDPAADEVEDLPSVGSSNFQGGRAGTRHLLELGHERIAVVGGPQELLACRARVAGFHDVMNTRQISVDPSLITFSELSVEGGFEQALKLLQLPEPPTAIFASSDLQALGVYRAAAELGVRIPGDLSVVGYDGLPVCDWVSPELTSVAQPLAEMTARATELALELAAGNTRRHGHIDLALSLQVRRSTAPPRG